MARTLQQVQAIIQSNSDVYGDRPDLAQALYEQNGLQYDGFLPIVEQEGGWWENPNIVPEGTEGVPWEPEFVAEAPPSQNTGSTGNDQWDVFNPVTGKYESVSGNYRPGDGNAIWGNVGGDRVLIRTDIDGWEQYGARKSGGDNDSDWTWGYQPPIRPAGEGSDLTLGGVGPSIGSPEYIPPTTLPPLSGPDVGGTPPPTNTPPPVTTQPPPTTTQPPPTNTPLDPIVNEPTDDWFPVDWEKYPGYENAPPPDGDGSFRPVTPEDPVPVDTSWNWDFFRDKAPGDRQWGGYDQDYQAFERYQPGMDSPWGMPNIKGGNEDFYQQQFVNQLRDEQGFRNRQRAAQIRASEIANEPAQDISPQEMWSWAYGDQGLPEVKLGGGARTPTYDLMSQFTPGESTFGDMLRWAGGTEAFSGDKKRINNWLAKDPNLDSTYWSRVGDPNKIIQGLGQDSNLDPQNRDMLSRLARSVYQEGDLGPYAPAGYASPIQWGGDYNSYAAGGA